jgi:dolichol-phosphate mannosyltransferase
MKPLIVLPSYNERENIVQLITAILSQYPESSVCVVDDSSPDGTAALLKEKIEISDQWSKRVHLIIRDKKDGRGGAVRDGFIWGIAQSDDYDTFIEMDCDFSHEPEAIGEGLALLSDNCDVVIGARYPKGKIIGWPASRRVFSFFANTLARALIDWSISDYTNGFRFYSRRAVQHLVGQPQKNVGYIYLSETLSYMRRANFQVASFPINFKNRERGVSNTSFKEIASALTGIFSIALDHHLNK